MKLHLFTSIGCLAVALTCPAQLPNWTGYKPSPAPNARQNSAMAYDSARKVCVLFGAWDGTQRRNDTWEWDGKSWKAIATATSPSPRDAMALVYDSARKVVVCAGGYVSPNDTWEYDGKNWTQVPTTNRPSLGAHSPMVYDSARKVCVAIRRSVTWEYDGKDWKRVTTKNAPGGSAWMAYDSHRQVTVLFESNRTWEYDGKDWTQITTNTLPPRRSCVPAMVYDSDRQVVVMFGGCGQAQGATWEYDGSDWRVQKTKNAPSAPRRYVAAAYDSDRRRTVLFGGRDYSLGVPRLVGDTWEYAGSPFYMTADVPSISYTTGGVQQFQLDAGTANRARLYVVAGSMTGTSPGFAINGADVPLNIDAYTGLATTLIRFGVTDGTGKATTRFIVPGGFNLSGTFYLHHAAVLVTGFPWVASNSTAIKFMK